MLLNLRLQIAELLERIATKLRTIKTAQRVRTTDRESVPQVTSEEIAEYWTGRGVNYRRLWASYDLGYGGYVEKYKSREVHLFVVEFRFPPSHLPLVDHEAVLSVCPGTI